MTTSKHRKAANSIEPGSASLAGELAPKRLQLLRELIPNAAAFGVLADPAFPVTQSTITDLQAAVRTLGRQLIVLMARTDSDIETAFATFSQQRIGAVLVSNGNFLSRHLEQLAALAARYALPAIYQYREFAMAGGLMSYGSSVGYLYHQAGIYTGRIRPRSPLAEGRRLTPMRGSRRDPRVGPYNDRTHSASLWTL